MTNGTVVGIHQPNLLPWLGFLDKLHRADVFVLLDEVQLNRRSVTNRVRILGNNAPTWFTVPVTHEGDQALTIASARVNLDERARRKLVRTLQQTYGKTPGWAPWGERIAAIIGDPPERLVDLNETLLRVLVEAFELDWGKARWQHDLESVGTASELMASLTAAAGGSTYLSGGWPPNAGSDQASGADYNDLADFTSRGLELVYQCYEQPTYEQPSDEFVPGLSALDALMHLGPDAPALIHDRPGSSSVD